jgi:hypothetical protein
VAHLNLTYSGNLTALSADWGFAPANSLSGFADVRIREGMGRQTFSDIQVLTWKRFNQHRVSDWFGWLCGRIKHHYATVDGNGNGGELQARCHIKTSNGNSPLGSGHGNGIDRVAIARGIAGDVANCDSRDVLLGHGTFNKETVPVTSHMPFAQLNATAYAMDWWSIARALLSKLSISLQPPTPYF